MLALIILDGWGYREDPRANAIAAAKKPCWDTLWERYPHTSISGSGKCVGLPDGQMGNSEVGHMNMGAGRVIHQDLTRIDLAIETREFFKNPAFLSALEKIRENGKALHILGLLSPGGVHSHEKHLQALLNLAATEKINQVYIHAFLDGRDTPPQSAMASLKIGKIASMIGRYYAMDRDKRWDRTQKAYELLTEGKADFYEKNPIEALKNAYARGETDEFVKPTALQEKISDGDAVIFMNFRADRARQLTAAFVDPHFKDFERHVCPKLSSFITLTEYDKTLPVTVAFPAQDYHHLFAECVSDKEFKQLRIAETEKYAHVTYFFNGGREEAFPGEERILIPSPKVATYDLQPEMSAPELTEQLVKAIKSKKYETIICNYANPDMLGHTGNFAATVKAIEAIDACLVQVIQALKEVDGEALITADHGNAEFMFDESTMQPHTAHTCELVPVLYIGRKAKITKLNGKLADIAPTMLYLMNLPQPPEMTGERLFTLCE